MTTKRQFHTPSQHPWLEYLLPVVLWALYFTVYHDPISGYIRNSVLTLKVPFLQLALGLYISILMVAMIWTTPLSIRPGLRDQFTIFFFICLVLLTQHVGAQGLVEVRSWFVETIEPDSSSFWWMLACYALVLAIPFVPGVEIGLLLMLVYGKAGIFSVYLMTIVGLFIPYLVGRFVPKDVMKEWLVGRTHMPGTRPPNFGGRLYNKLLSVHPDYRGLRIKPLILGIAFNVPGNAVIGGGGAVALATGVTRFVSTPMYLLVVAVATLPVPLLAYLGILQVEWLLPNP